MHPLPLVVFLTLAAGPDRPIPDGCREDFETCREDCTIDYGGGTTKYRQLSECVHRCDKEQKECANQHYSLQDADIDPLPARKPEPEPEPESKSESEPRSESKPEPAPQPAPKRTEQPEPKKDISDWDPDAD